MINLDGFSDDEQARFYADMEKIKNLIIAERELAIKETIAINNSIEIHRIAADYKDWLLTNKRGTSFSTFVTEFGFDSMLAKCAYEMIMSIFAEVNKFVKPDSALFADVDYPKPPYFFAVDADADEPEHYDHD